MRLFSLGTIGLVFLLGSPLAAQEATTPFNCFPTCSETDGKMMSLAGKGLSTLGGDFINLTLVSDGGGFEIGIFDGESDAAVTGRWDRRDPSEVLLPPNMRTQLRVHLLADPNGDGTGLVEVGFPGGWYSNLDNVPTSGTFFSTSVNGVASGKMPDNDWFDIDVIDSPAAAAAANSDCPPGNYCYRLLVNLINPAGNMESNFKVRTTAQMSLRPLAFSFVGAMRSMADAAVIYPRLGLGDLSVTTYDGNWEFTMRVDDPVTFFSVWDGDMDYGAWDCSVNDSDDFDTCMNTDPDSTCVPNTLTGFVGEIVPPWADGTASRTEGVALAPGALPTFPCGPTGSPPDDMNPLLFPAFPGFFTRSPSISYELETPVGTFSNSNPSGNQEWEQFRLETDPMKPADFHVASLPAGTYVLRLSGLDASNLNALRMSADVLSVPSASLGDRVWLDLDGDGNQDAGEPGINGVDVRLYRDADGDGMLDPAIDTLIATQTTSGDGNYDFLGLGGGNYFVDVVESTLPPDLHLSLTTGNEPYNTPAGPYPLRESEDHDDADFGYAYGAIGDLVWLDSNGNGIFEPVAGEIGISNVDLRLDGDADGDGGADQLFDSTGVDGLYLYDVLFFGDYDVTVLASNFGAGGALSGLVPTFDFDGGLDNTSFVIIPDTGGARFLEADFGYRPLVPRGTGTPGYWKNHPEAWPVDGVTIGGIFYDRDTAITFLTHKKDGDREVIMFSHLVSAKLNIGIGNDWSCIDPTIFEADDWMAMYPLGSGIGGSDPAWRIGEPLKKQLDRYNNGKLDCAEARD